MASKQPVSGKAPSRLQQRLEQKFADGNFYEAHQLCRTLYFRYKSQGKTTDVVDVLFDGAERLFRCGQEGSGYDLCFLLLNFIYSESVTSTERLVERLSDLHSLISDGKLKEDFVSLAIKWSKKCSSFENGDPRLHRRFAETYWSEKNYAHSRRHFLHSSDGESFSNMLIEFQTSQGYIGEVDMFVAQAVLQSLCLQNAAQARIVFIGYTQRHPRISTEPPFQQPLLNFVWFLLLALDDGRIAIFTALVELYQPSLRRDPAYLRYLDRIGQLFFGLPPPPVAAAGGGGGDFISNLLQSFLADDEGEGPGVASAVPAAGAGALDLD